MFPLKRRTYLLLGFRRMLMPHLLLTNKVFLCRSNEFDQTSDLLLLSSPLTKVHVPSEIDQP